MIIIVSHAVGVAVVLFPPSLSLFTDVPKKVGGPKSGEAAQIPQLAAMHTKAAIEVPTTAAAPEEMTATRIFFLLPLGRRRQRCERVWALTAWPLPRWLRAYEVGQRQQWRRTTSRSSRSTV